MPPTLSLQELRALDPCDYSYHSKMLRKFGKGPYSAADAVAAGVSPADLIWVATEIALNNPDIGRRLVLFAADCAARVLYIYEREYPNDRRPREAIIADRRFAKGGISDTARSAAKAIAWDAARAAWTASHDTSRAAESAALCDADYCAIAARYAAGYAARYAARYTAEPAALYAAGYAASAAERRWQKARLVKWFSDKEPRPLALPKIHKAA